MAPGRTRSQLSPGYTVPSAARVGRSAGAVGNRSLGAADSVAALVAAEVMPLAGVAVVAAPPSPEHAASASVPRRAAPAVRRAASRREVIRSRLPGQEVLAGRLR